MYLQPSNAEMRLGMGYAPPNLRIQLTGYSHFSLRTKKTTSRPSRLKIPMDVHNTEHIFQLRAERRSGNTLNSVLIAQLGRLSLIGS